VPDVPIRQTLREVIDTLDSARPSKPDANSLVDALAAEPNREASTPALLDELRLKSRYLVFELEATRRENRAIRKIMHARSRLRQMEREDDGLL
jgi:hypothetical protein